MNMPLIPPAPGVVAIGGYNQARRHARKYDAVLTVEEPVTRDRLRLVDIPQFVTAFEDCDDVTLGYAVATRDQVEQALAFLAQHEAGAVLVHCFHGVGRSAALALAGQAQRWNDAKRATEWLYATRPQSTPNLVVVEHADAILGQNGQLLAAVTEAERQDRKSVV